MVALSQHDSRPRQFSSPRVPMQPWSCRALPFLKVCFQPLEQPVGCEMSSRIVAFGVSGRFEGQCRPLAARIYSRPLWRVWGTAGLQCVLNKIFCFCARKTLSTWQYTVRITVSTSRYLNEICVMQTSVDSCTLMDTESSSDLKHSDRF